ncbi:MAG: FAD-dependent oxidoreductase, partial [Desulfobacterales bacterium]|nr:FAD-dependent oxidoreductase [Desulfobacterales bacterium]
TGPATVVEAVAHGKEAAISIDRFIQGEDLMDGREKEWRGVQDVPVEIVPKVPKQIMPALEPDTRMDNFTEVQLGFDETITTAEADRCLECGVCSECYQCVEACLADAVCHEQIQTERQIEVGSVVLSPGSRPYDPSGLDAFYHYQTNPNVLTSLEFERLLSASGPTMGHLAKPSDDKEPKKIAWLQCVGSRDTNRCNNGYCSSVCCMYAIKDAMIAKEHSGGDLDCAIFNMDIRTFGKEYEKYYNRAKDKEGVRFVKARVHTIDEVGPDRSLRIRYAGNNGDGLQEEFFDMVVLSVGLQVTESVADLAKR